MMCFNRKSIFLALAITGMFQQAYAADAVVPDNSFVPNIGVVNDYRFRGISQSRFDPAVQGGLDYSNAPTGLYLGVWASNIKWIKDAAGQGSVEVDLYGGKKGNIGATDFTYDVGGLYYYYPDNNYGRIGNNANTFELYGQVGYGPYYVKYSNALTTAFGTPGSKHSGYYDAGATYTLPYDVSLLLHVGHQTVRNFSFGSYTDWKIGVSRAFPDLAGVTLGVAFVGTNAHDGAYVSPSGKNLGRNGVVVSLSKSF